MNIREAILRAADHIEARPEAYRFHANGEPSCNSPGCMMGWIASYAGVQADIMRSYVGLACDQLGFSYDDIVNLWSKLPSGNPLRLVNPCYDAKCAAAVMRLYADRYHPATPALFPNWNAMATGPAVAAHAVSQEVRA